MGYKYGGAASASIVGGVTTTAPLGGDGSVANPVDFVGRSDPIFYVDPVAGSDANAGTIGAPFQTLNKALFELAPGWFGTATVNLRAGTSTIGNRTVLPSPLGASSTTAGGLLIVGIDNTDSGLGARTSAGGTAGSLATFGTCVDSVGGLVVNAHRGRFLRFTSGASLNGRSFLIVSNTATTFTIAGTFPVAPTVETFVVETPAAVLSWAGIQAMQAQGAVGFDNIAFSGSGGANSLRFSGGTIGLQRCTFAAIGTGGIALRNGVVLTDLSALTSYFGTLAITQQCGSFFSSALIVPTVSSVSGMYGGGISLNRSLFVDSPTECSSPIQVQYLSCFFTGNSYVRAVYGASLLFGQNRMDTVTPAPAVATAFVNALGAAIVVSKGSKGAFFNSDISNTPATTAPGDAILCEDASVVTLSTITGTGNAGIGCRVSRLSQARNVTGNTVTGTGGDVKVGTAPVLPWAVVGNASNISELCLVTTP